jgi:lipid II:glycine glycyltransferase (peptidoglycan interpeptide bridge formation enzyme)
MTRPDVWDALVAGHPAGSILQTGRWGQLKADFGWDWEIATPEAAAGGGAMILYKPLPLKLGTIAYVPRGPVVDWADAQAAAAVMTAIDKAARRRRAWALWIEPELLDSPEARAQLRALGLAPAPRTVQPPRTIAVDVALPEAEILARMKSKTRYNIRLAARKGVTVHEGDLGDVAAFYALMTETGERDVFGVHSEAYYRRVLELFLPAGQAALLLAEVEGEAVAGLVVFAMGRKAWYFYGASSEKHREKMPPYALQWEAIRWAKARGCAVYDLWGIPDADEETLEAQFSERSDGLWGVYRFKRGFGGQVVRYVGLWEKALHPLYPLAAHLRGGLNDG